MGEVDTPAAQGDSITTVAASSSGREDVAASGEGDRSEAAVSALPDAVVSARVRPEMTAEERLRLATAGAARTAKQRDNAKQVNEYVLWAIENQMWQEARLHLERAAAEDSLAGSLYNNLGLVYERLGMSADAETAYERANALNPQRQAYSLNLERLLKRREKAAQFEPARLDSLKQEIEGLRFERP